MTAGATRISSVVTIISLTADSNGTVRIHMAVRNIGTTAGSTVAQLYAATPFTVALVMLVVPVTEMLPEWKAQLSQWGWVWTVLAPFVSFLFAWNFIVSLLSRRMNWRNVRYELLSPHATHVLR